MPEIKMPTDRNQHQFAFWRGCIAPIALGIVAGYTISISSYAAAWCAIFLGLLVGVASALVGAPRSITSGTLGVLAEVVTVITIASLTALKLHLPTFSDMGSLVFLALFLSVSGGVGVAMVVRNARP